MAAEVRPGRRPVAVRVLCSGCLYAEPGFVERGTGAEHPVLECHRFPPGLVFDPNTSAVVQVWPQMAEADWCGEGTPA